VQPLSGIQVQADGDEEQWGQKPGGEGGDSGPRGVVHTVVDGAAHEEEPCQEGTDDEVEPQCLGEQGIGQGRDQQIPELELGGLAPSHP